MTVEKTDGLKYPVKPCKNRKFDESAISIMNDSKQVEHSHTEPEKLTEKAILDLIEKYAENGLIIKGIKIVKEEGEVK